MLVTSTVEKILIKNYFSGEWPHPTQIDHCCISSFSAALREARSSTGRSLEDGVIIDSQKSGNWAGACMYLILIDHIGEKFKRNGFVSNSTGAFILALQNFTGLSQDEIEILYQLRNSFLHQFNLYNFPQKKSYKKRHFVVHRGAQLITFPIQEFDGDLANITSNNATMVSLVEIGNLVEEMCSEITTLLNSDQLIVKTELDGTIFSLEEYLQANTVCYQKNP